MTDGGTSGVDSKGAAEGTDAPAAPGGVQPATTTPGAGRRIRAWLIALFVILALAAIGTAAYFGYQRVTARQAAEDDVDRAIMLVERADGVVLDVDEIVRAEIEEGLADQAAATLEDIPDAREDLGEALVLIGRALPDLPQGQVEEAQALRGSAQARLDMLEPADLILEANAMAARALGPADEGWGMVLEGESIADRAVAEYNKLTDPAVAESKRLTEEAQAKVREGRDLLQEAADAFPDADLAPFIEYADAKLAALDVSNEANEAFLAGDTEEANTLSNQYNEAERKLLELAGELPASPAAQIASAYEAKAGDATTEYFDARERATKADALLDGFGD